MPDYAPGTPSWVELASPDTDASIRFYGELMGWSATEPGSEETGGYRMFQQDGKNIGGLMRTMQEGQPTAWATYMSVADAEETAAKVKAAGGSVVVEPMDVMDIGRMAVFVDPTGAVFGVWQPKSFTGADIVNEPDSLCWNEVLTRDADAGKAFYSAVFGWQGRPPAFEGAPEIYTVWELDGKQVGGHDANERRVFPGRDPAALGRGLRGRRLRRHRREGPRAWGNRHERADGHADRTLRRPDRSPGSLLHGDASGALRLIGLGADQDHITQLSSAVSPWR